jgi:hypothetical protein
VLLLSIDGVPDSDMRVVAGELDKTAVVTRLENRLTGLDHLRDDTTARIERLRAEVARAGDMLGKPFPHAEALTAARERVETIDEEIKELAKGGPEAAPGAAGATPEAPAPPLTRSDWRQQWVRRPLPAPAPPAATQSVAAPTPKSRLTA